MSEHKIPKELFSYDTGEPFTHCMICQIDLMNPPKQYLIEKSIKRYPEHDHVDVIYEYAMCFECMMKQQEYISKESLQNLMEYMQSIRFNPDKLMDEEGRMKVPDTCTVHGHSIQEMTEYVIQGTFRGKNPDENIPMMLFGQYAMEEMQELLSVQTRDGMDDFMDRWFSGPPEFRELLRERKTVLI